MADTAISGFPAASTLTGAELLAGVQSAANVKATVAQVGVYTRSSVKIFFVDDYGAVGDSNGTTGNGTNNTVALLACMAAAVANGGGIVMLGEGIYRYLGTILSTTGSNNIVIRGFGKGISALFFDDATTNSPALQIAGDYSGAEYFTFLGRKTFLSNGHSVYFTGADDSFLTGVEIKNSNCFGVMILNSARVTVRDCIAWAGAADGFHCSIGVSNIKFFDNISHDNADDGFGIGFEGSTINVECAGNTSYRNATGFSIQGYDPGDNVAQVYDINVHDNEIYETWLEGIRIHVSQGGIKNVTLDNNIIRDAGSMTPTADIPMRASGIAAGISLLTIGGALSRPFDNIQITNNKILNARNSFIYIGIGGGSSTTHGGILVENNQCDGISTTGGAGAWGFGFAGNQNTPSPASYPGIYAAIFSNVQILSNYIKGANQEAIRFDTGSILSCRGAVTCMDNVSVGANVSNSATSIFQYGSTSSLTIYNVANNISVSAANPPTSNNRINTFGSGNTIYVSHAPQDGYTYTQPAQDNSFHRAMLQMNPGAHLRINAGTENPDFIFNLTRNVQWKTGALALQRFFRITAPTLTFQVLSTATNVYTAYFEAPNGSATATITNPWALGLTGNFHVTGNIFIGTAATPTARLHLPAGTTAASTGPLKFTTGTVMTAPEAGSMEYNNTFHLTNSDATRRHVVLAPNLTKVTAGAPYTNDGYLTVNVGGTDFKFMTTA